MEFVIEELSPSPKVTTEIGWPQRTILKLKVSIIQLYHYVQSFFRNLSVKGELCVFVIMVSLLTVGFVAHDLWQIRQQKLTVTALQKHVRTLSLQQQALQKEALPMIDKIQRRWLRQREENSRDLLELLTSLSMLFQHPIRMTSLQKKHQDPIFYLEGSVSNFAGIFQLESFLQSLKWQATITLLSSDEPQVFSLKMQPLHRVIWNE